MVGEDRRVRLKEFALQQFFPVEMIGVPAVFAVDERRQTEVEDALRVSKSTMAFTDDPSPRERSSDRTFSISDPFSTFQSRMDEDEDEDEVECPQVFSLVWIRIGRLNAWRRTHMLLRDRKLYLAKKVSPSSHCRHRVPSIGRLVPGYQFSAHSFHL